MDNKYDRIKSINKKFNGRLIIKYLDVEESTIVGKYIKLFKEKYSDDQILEMSDDEIKNNIINLKYGSE